MVEYSRSVVVDGQDATFDPPIEAIYILDGDGNIEITINGVTVTSNVGDLLKGQVDAASTPLVLIPGCTDITIVTATNLKYIALRDAGYPPKAPNDTLTTP